MPVAHCRLMHVLLDAVKAVGVEHAIHPLCTCFGVCLDARHIQPVDHRLDDDVHVIVVELVKRRVRANAQQRSHLGGQAGAMVAVGIAAEQSHLVCNGALVAHPGIDAHALCQRHVPC